MSVLSDAPRRRSMSDAAMVREGGEIVLDRDDQMALYRGSRRSPGAQALKVL
jgi:hypothetical protein